MWFSDSSSCMLAMILMVVMLDGADAGTVGDVPAPEPASAQARAATGDVGDLRWDLAEAFGFEWKSTEVSAKITDGTDPNTPLYTATVVVRPFVLDSKGLVALDLESPGVCEVLDQNGDALGFEPMQSDQSRRYDFQHLSWEGKIWNSLRFEQVISVKIRLSSTPVPPSICSIGHIEGYIYAVYADDIVEIDIPFDPNAGWNEFEPVPDLIFRIDSTTPPCPGPLRSVGIPTSNPRLPRRRPVTPVPLYKYQSWVKSKTREPIMALYDLGGWYQRDLYPLSKYAVVRTELFDSKNTRSYRLFTQWIESDPSGDVGAACYGQKEQDYSDAYDSVRHIIAINPVEVKIPFVLSTRPSEANWKKGNGAN